MSDVEKRAGEREQSSAVVYHTTEDLEETDLSTAVLAGLDSVPGYDVEDSDTVVFDHIDLDALDELFARKESDDPQGRVTFPIGEYLVTATASGEITIRIN